MISPLIWPGGKGQMMNKILKHIPDHKYYLEPFFGGGNLFFSKNKVSHETINDINSDVINFFKLLQDKNKFKQFHELLELTPYSREIFNESIKYKKFEHGSVKRVYYWFILLRQSFSGKSEHWSYSLNNTDNRKLFQTVSGWLNIIKLLPEIAARLKYIQIENDDFESIIKRYDNKDCFIYCDPPYLHETRKSKKLYEYEMRKDDHVRFLKCCNEAISKIMISGYDSYLYNEYLKSWIKKQFKVKIIMNNSRISKNTYRTEMLWMNYKPEQPDLFFTGYY